jgi:hypothetical protein
MIAAAFVDWSLDVVSAIVAILVVVVAMLFRWTLDLRDRVARLEGPRDPWERS